MHCYGFQSTRLTVVMVILYLGIRLQTVLYNLDYYLGNITVMTCLGNGYTHIILHVLYVFLQERIRTGD